MQSDTVITVDNQLGHDFTPWGMFIQADPVVKAVIIILIIASVLSWAIIIDKSLTLGRLRAKAKKFEDAFWSGKPLDELYSKMKDRADHPMARVFAAAMGEWERSRGTPGRSDAMTISANERIEKVMNVTVARELEKAESQMSVLATIGSAAPFVGLFGTVWGIMNAFQGIAISGDANLAVVAPGISEALFVTALGLVAAIPAVAGYNRYTSQINSYAVRLQGFADEFAAILSRQMDERAK